MSEAELPEGFKIVDTWTPQDSTSDQSFKIPTASEIDVFIESLKTNSQESNVSKSKDRSDSKKKRSEKSKKRESENLKTDPDRKSKVSLGVDGVLVKTIRLELQEPKQSREPKQNVESRLRKPESRSKHESVSSHSKSEHFSSHGKPESVSSRSKAEHYLSHSKPESITSRSRHESFSSRSKPDSFSSHSRSRSPKRLRCSPKKSGSFLSRSPSPRRRLSRSPSRPRSRSRGRLRSRSPPRDSMKERERRERYFSSKLYQQEKAKARERIETSLRRRSRSRSRSLERRREERRPRYRSRSRSRERRRSPERRDYKSYKEEFLQEILEKLNGTGASSQPPQYSYPAHSVAIPTPDGYPHPAYSYPSNYPYPIATQPAQMPSYQGAASGEVTGLLDQSWVPLPEAQPADQDQGFTLPGILTYESSRQPFSRPTKTPPPPILSRPGLKAISTAEDLTNSLPPPIRVPPRPRSPSPKRKIKRDDSYKRDPYKQITINWDHELRTKFNLSELHRSSNESSKYSPSRPTDDEPSMKKKSKLDLEFDDMSDMSMSDSEDVSFVDLTKETPKPVPPPPVLSSFHTRSVVPPPPAQVPPTSAPTPRLPIASTGPIPQFAAFSRGTVVTSISQGLDAPVTSHTSLVKPNVNSVLSSGLFPPTPHGVSSTPSYPNKISVLANCERKLKELYRIRTTQSGAFFPTKRNNVVMPVSNEDDEEPSVISLANHCIPYCQKKEKSKFVWSYEPSQDLFIPNTSKWKEEIEMLKRDAGRVLKPVATVSKTGWPVYKGLIAKAQSIPLNSTIPTSQITQAQRVTSIPEPVTPLMAQLEPVTPLMSQLEPVKPLMAQLEPVTSLMPVVLSPEQVGELTGQLIVSNLAPKPQRQKRPKPSTTTNNILLCGSAKKSGMKSNQPESSGSVSSAAPGQIFSPVSSTTSISQAETKAPLTPVLVSPTPSIQLNLPTQSLYQGLDSALGLDQPPSGYEASTKPTLVPSTLVRPPTASIQKLAKPPNNSKASPLKPAPDVCTPKKAESPKASTTKPGTPSSAPDTFNKTIIPINRHLKKLLDTILNSNHQYAAIQMRSAFLANSDEFDKFCIKDGFVCVKETQKIFLPFDCVEDVIQVLHKSANHNSLLYKKIQSSLQHHFHPLRNLESIMKYALDSCKCCRKNAPVLIQNIPGKAEVSKSITLVEESKIQCTTNQCTTNTPSTVIHDKSSSNDENKTREAPVVSPVKTLPDKIPKAEDGSALKVINGSEASGKATSEPEPKIVPPNYGTIDLTDDPEDKGATPSTCVKTSSVTPQVKEDDPPTSEPAKPELEGQIQSSAPPPVKPATSNFKERIRSIQLNSSLSPIVLELESKSKPTDQSKHYAIRGGLLCISCPPGSKKFKIAVPQDRINDVIEVAHTMAGVHVSFDKTAAVLNNHFNIQSDLSASITDVIEKCSACTSKK